MNESLLKALLQLFAMVAQVNKNGISKNARIIVESYLKRKLNNELVQKYLRIFNKYLAYYHNNKTNKANSHKVTSVNNIENVLNICSQINKGLEQKEKAIVLLRLIEFVNEDKIINEGELEFITIVSESFNIDKIEFDTIKEFILNEIDKTEHKNRFLIINNKQNLTEKESDIGKWFDRNRPAHASQFKHIYRPLLDGEISILHLPIVRLFIFQHKGTQALYLNGHHITPDMSYIFDSGSIIKNPKVGPVYYSDVASKFLLTSEKEKIKYSVVDAAFIYKNSENGIQKFSINEESGQLIGIMGGSGVGKSTLLNVLNGELHVTDGKIFINGYDLYENKNELEGIIGFIPQDDMLIEELSVFQNLYYNARLCFSDFSKEKIKTLVTKLLLDLELFDIKDFTVGSVFNKVISGGQRKRLNIALELIREPNILLVDEPTSGLSSMDSEKVVLLLKEQCLKGKLVIANIHQPSSDIFKLFDKLMIIDTGGYIIYYGNPVDAIVYFKTMSQYVNAEERECYACGNVNPEQVLQIIDERIVNENGKFTRQRRTSPKEWYDLFNNDTVSKALKLVSPKQLKLPKKFFSTPGLVEQFRIFTKRNILKKLTNTQYLLINFLEAPFLALILGFFTKYTSGSENNAGAYVFSENDNLFAYIFMSIIVALFMGLTVSAEEIFKDRKIRKREKFLNLSWFSYINSKVFIMLVISAIQTISFVLVGNFILEIKGLSFEYWLVLFSCSFVANMVGLNISSGLNSVVTIYILIPLILVPQLLFAGVIVSFDKLHKSIANEIYTPFISDLMPSRWAFEALAVCQFKNNKYQNNFYDYNIKISEANYQSRFLIPKLSSKLDYCLLNKKLNTNKAEVTIALNIIKNEISLLSKKSRISFKSYNELTFSKLDQIVVDKSKIFLEKNKTYYNNIKNKIAGIKDNKIRNIKESLGSDACYELKKKFSNNQLAEIVLNKQKIKTMYVTDDRIIRLKDPIYNYPVSNYGRAHFYSPVKIIGNNQIETFWFNVLVIWLISILLYITLYFDVLKNLMRLSEKRRLRKKNKKLINRQ